MTDTRGNRKKLIGQVVSDKMDNTVVVSIVTKVKDPSYGKYLNKTKRFFAHDEKNECRTGDQVEIVDCRPMSKNKRWRVAKVLSHSVENAAE